MRIAIVGAGVSGLVSAWLLARRHEVVLLERDTRLGGHTRTIPVTWEGQTFPVDTGFIVFNERNYPYFSAMLRALGVATRPTTMSFSVRDEKADFEYGGASLMAVVGRWQQLAHPRWWRVVSGLVHLARRGKAILAELPPETTLEELIEAEKFSRGFLEDYLLPMAAAIWSAPQAALLDFPAHFVLRFFDHHGMLDLRERPQWRTILGGSHTYVRALRSLLGPIARVGAAVERVVRHPDGVEVSVAGATEHFDHVVFATHADQALALLSDATPTEQQILAAMPFQSNTAVLHHDARQLPRRRRCWAAWNYRITHDRSRPVPVTYDLSILQRLRTRHPICVTLNDDESIEPRAIFARMTYEHPLYTRDGERARARWSEISGVHRTHYCGAYWGHGFHEDGVVSAVRVCERLGVPW